MWLSGEELIKESGTKCECQRTVNRKNRGPRDREEESKIRRKTVTPTGQNVNDFTKQNNVTGNRLNSSEARGGGWTDGLIHCSRLRHHFLSSFLFYSEELLWAVTSISQEGTDPIYTVTHLETAQYNHRLTCGHWAVSLCLLHFLWYTCCLQLFHFFYKTFIRKVKHVRLVVPNKLKLISSTTFSSFTENNEEPETHSGFYLTFSFKKTIVKVFMYLISYLEKYLVWTVFFSSVLVSWFASCLFVFDFMFWVIINITVSVKLI